MDTLLPKLYKEYGLYSNWRQLPSELDGLKPVERRILFSAYQIARTKLAKSARVDGHVIGNYHPHGSVYGSIVQLVRQGLLEGQGNFGCNVGVEPVGAAASRYTEIKLPESTINLAFQNLKYVKWERNDLDQDEPLFLPVKFPICLLGQDYTQGIGFGYRTLIPCYTVGNLFSRLKWLLGELKTKPTIAPITDCEITSQPRVLEQLLTTGEAKVDVTGVLEINKMTNVATLKSWPPGKRFEAILKKLEPHLSSGEIGFSDLSTTETKIVFKVLRERNRDKIFNSFLKKMQAAITGSISFSVLVTTTEGTVVTKSVDNLLLETFERFKGTTKDMLLASIDEIQRQIEEYQLLAVIRPDIGRCLNDNNDYHTTIGITSRKTGIDQDTIEKLVQKYRIKKLLTIDLDTKELIDKKEELDQNVKDIDNFALAQYGGQ